MANGTDEERSYLGPKCAAAYGNWSMNTFLIENNDRDDNLGDQIISRNLANTLSQFGNVRIQGEPKPYHQFPTCTFDLSDSRRRRTLGAITGHRYYRVFPAGGWGKIPDSGAANRQGAPVPDKPAGSLSPAAWLKDRIKVRDIVLGVSIEISPTNPAFDDYFWVGARDTSSINSLRQRPCITADYFPDLAFFENTEDAAGSPEDMIAISFRESNPEANSTGLDENAIDALTRMKNCPGAPATSLFYFQVNEDATFNENLAQRVSWESSFHNEKLDLESYPTFYKRPRFVAGNRLHCLLLGAVNGAVPVAIVSKGHRKITELFETVGWEDLIVLLDEPEVMTEKFEQIIARADHYRDLVLRSCSEQQALGMKEMTTKFA